MEGYTREELTKATGKEVYDTNEVTAKFKIESFLAPFCYGKDRETGEEVTLQFQHMPRFYWRA